MDMTEASKEANDSRHLPSNSPYFVISTSRYANGAAVHKMQPSAGQGAVSAMQDAVILVNCLYDIERAIHVNIKTALADYRAQRYKHAEFQVKFGKKMAKIMFGQRRRERLARQVIYHMPKWCQINEHMKMATYRPLITFLPPIPNVTKMELEYQKPSKRYAKEQAASNQAAHAAAVAI
ncbi:hypothetical protein BGZ93_005008 [Podila epicladia]|nr:hypothetical protein BGZ93_005008 [Podila epicladia]